MNYNAIYVSLDYAQKYGAERVVVDMDNGTYDMTPDEAMEEFNSLAPGEAFTLLSIHFN